MFSLAMKRVFVAEGKFSINKSRSFHDVVIASDLFLRIYSTPYPEV